MRLLDAKPSWKLSALLTADIIVFGLTNARSSPSFVLMVAFLLLAANFYYLINFLLGFAWLYGLSVKRKRRLTAFLTAFFAGTTALRSMGGLNGRDLLVLLPLITISYFYGFYAKAGYRAYQGAQLFED